jgi:hypothetical protein
VADEIRVAIAVPPDDLVAIGQSAAKHGVIQEAVDESTAEQLEIGILAAVLLIGVGLAVSRVIVDLWERWRGGLEIDLTKQPTKISRNHEIPMGYIVTLMANGKVQIEVKDEPKDSIERLTEAILKLPVAATVDTAKEVIDKVLGKGDATTTATPAT